MAQFAEALRLTAFLGVSPPKDPTWWSDLTGSQPETRVSKPQVGLSQETGTLEGRTLVLSVQPGRVDWLLNPGPSQLEGSEISSIGEVTSALNIFVPQMLRWLETAPPITRLAYGATLLEPVGDTSAGYNRLAELLPAVHIDPKASSDFLYQINRPRKSTSNIENLSVNRLSAWSVVSLRKFSISFAVGSPPIIPVEPSQVGETATAVRIALDISTTPNFHGELPHVRLGEIFEEFIDLAAELATRGDVA
jgi:hypothetical protein